MERNQFVAVRAAIAFSFVFLAILNAQPIETVIRQSDPSLTQTSILRRTQVAPNLDLVIAIAGARTPSGPITWWGEKEKLGLFLQEQSNPGRVYTLTLTPGIPDCSVRILRATATDTVVQCTEEKSAPGPNHKFVYDIRAKSLISHFFYQPFAMRRIISRSGNGALIIGTDNTRQIAVDFQPDSKPEFSLLRHTEPEASPAARPAPPIIHSHPLPRPTYAQFAQARPGRVNDGYKSNVEFDDHVGPWVLEGGNVWFGKSFYDGEGTTGIGGFGYFDAAEKRYHLYAPQEIVDYSVSAIHVDADAVWMALVHNGEYGGSSGGLLRFDRNSNAIRKFEMPDIGLQFGVAGGKLLLATNSGFAVIVNGEITRYFVDKTTDGRLRLAQE